MNLVLVRVAAKAKSNEESIKLPLLLWHLNRCIKLGTTLRRYI